ncbi:unnamed protein product [Rotaria sordida]|uniref:Disease resistance R13L4/SHOC-2-like LRR domain-containing protein n=1 Tax=Rotaria sordida TaxID=392033 RepID=A0A814H147_9BILA|nr:unnamed protein product [Rotaria sordida]
MFENDENVIKSFLFDIPLNRSKDFSKTYGLKYENGNIHRLNIVNQKVIPSTIFCLKYLKRLYIQNTCLYCCNCQQMNLIEYFPPSLTELSIKNTKITHLSESLGKLIHLQTLKLSNVGLTSLPNSIGNLSSLNMLYLPYNNLTSLPITIKKLQLLQQITLKNNSYLHSVEQLNGLESLEILDVRHCSIENLPRNLPQLIDLYMSNNNLKNLNGIQTLGYRTSSKKSFYFDMNHIRSVSPFIRNVRNLYLLKLNDNELETLPPYISDIRSLRILYIDKKF